MKIRQSVRCVCVCVGGGHSCVLQPSRSIASKKIYLEAACFDKTIGTCEVDTAAVAPKSRTFLPARSIALHRASRKLRSE